ncbi:hypothetical protein PMIN01_12344 [Paraphaeosphaeria minitans]|uniref:Uncharacterized protein n=1 Tax=Paraphaeosphaeria minitans TaxID=565426 RepID=A0A9P6G6S0_9PLEO|nr:hypothetical protein PMIN01_12344 [Paraphaeosphaeria minitans]
MQRGPPSQQLPASALLAATRQNPQSRSHAVCGTPSPRSGTSRLPSTLSFSGTLPATLCASVPVPVRVRVPVPVRNTYPPTCITPVISPRTSASAPRLRPFRTVPLPSANFVDAACVVRPDVEPWIPVLFESK